MAYNPNKELKLYYSIGEVAEMFGVNESLLRFWEKEFPMINPKKNAKGTRQYRKSDLDHIQLVYQLVKEKGRTLAGAKQRLKASKEDTVKNAEIIRRLQIVREELMSIKKELDWL